jgi:hypothetical protein
LKARATMRADGNGNGTSSSHLPMFRPGGVRGRHGVLHRRLNVGERRGFGGAGLRLHQMRPMVGAGRKTGRGYEQAPGACQCADRMNHTAQQCKAVHVKPDVEPMQEWMDQTDRREESLGR